MRRSSRHILSILLGLALLVLPVVCAAASFEYGYSTGSWGTGKLTGKGMLKFRWTPVMATSNLQDPLIGAYASFSRFDLYDALGDKKFDYGQTYKTIDSQPFTYGDEFVVTPDKPKNAWKVRDTDIQNAVFTGELNLSSIGFDNTGTVMTLTGYITNIGINNTIGSETLKQFQQGSQADFSLVISSPSKDLVAMLNKGKGNAAFHVNSGIVSGGGVAAPEPGTLALAGSALAGLVAWQRRRRKTAKASDQE